MKILCMIWIVLSLPFFACTTRAETNGATIPETGSPGDDTVADTVADTTVPTAEITSDDNVVVVVDEDNPMDIGRGAGNDVELEEGIDVTLDHPSGSEHDVKVSNPDTEDSSIADDEGTVPNPAPSQQHGSGKQRLWGSPVQYEDDEHHRTIPQEEQAVKEEHHHNYNTHIHNPPKVDIYQDEIEEHGATPTHNHHHHHNLHIPFVPKSTHPPPPGFLISARVYIDPKDKLGHLDEDPITLPYWDCGAVGSTTSPLKVTDVSFRHSLTPSQGWTGTDGKHPVLAIALSEFILEVSSGATKVIQSGEAVLLEDVLIAGHKVRPVSNHHPVRVMFLTLRKTHYSTGKDIISISSSYRNSNDPCPVPDGTRSNPPLQHVERNARILRVALGIAGLSLSTIVADFLGKTAPLWLAVGVGGLFFVVSTTVGTVVLGEAAANSFQAWQFQRRLKVDRAPLEDDQLAR